MNNQANGFNSVQANNALECQMKCQAESNCLLFVYQISVTTCHMKQESGLAKTGIDTDFITGPKYCTRLIGKTLFFTVEHST
jgi:hypothetical protein